MLENKHFDEFWFCCVCYSEDETSKSHHKSEAFLHLFLTLIQSFIDRLGVGLFQNFPSIQLSFCLLSSLTNSRGLSYLSSLIFN